MALYVTSGDGTSDSDADEMGQRPDVILSKLLRSTSIIRPRQSLFGAGDNPYVDDKPSFPKHSRTASAILAIASDEDGTSVT